MENFAFFVCSDDWHWPELCQSVSVITAQKAKFFNKHFFSKYDQIRRKLRIWSHLLKKSFIEKFIFCVTPKNEEDFSNTSCYKKKH